MNIYANNYFKAHSEKIKKIAQKWFRQYKGQYNRANLFEVEDLEQEIWAELFESSYVDEQDFIDETRRICDKYRKRGGRCPVEIPISQLNYHLNDEGKNEKNKINNLFYATGRLEDDYGEESFA